jgi:UDP-glucose 4-epimerase
MKALVTGGAGFIGSNLANLLVDRDYDVVVLDDLSLGIPENLNQGVELVHSTVTDGETVDKVVEGCNVVFHLAAKSSVTMIDDDPVFAEDVNVGGYLRVLQASRKFGVERVVYSSTSSMYSAIEPPHREDAVIYPRTLYEQNFLAREHIGSIYTNVYDLECVGMRFFSVYGPNEWHKEKYANLVSQFIWLMMDGERPVIYGDGSQTRDFTHVLDICEALILASKVEGVGGDVFNACTGKCIDLNRLVGIINSTLGTDLEPEYVVNPLRMYVARTLGDPTKAREKLGFEAKITIEEGVASLVEIQRGR